MVDRLAAQVSNHPGDCRDGFPKQTKGFHQVWCAWCQAFVLHYLRISQEKILYFLCLPFLPAALFGAEDSGRLTVSVIGKTTAIVFVIDGRRILESSDLLVLCEIRKFMSRKPRIHLPRGTREEIKGTDYFFTLRPCAAL